LFFFFFFFYFFFFVTVASSKFFLFSSTYLTFPNLEIHSSPLKQFWKIPPFVPILPGNFCCCRVVYKTFKFPFLLTITQNEIGLMHVRMERLKISPCSDTFNHIHRLNFKIKDLNLWWSCFALYFLKSLVIYFIGYFTTFVTGLIPSIKIFIRKALMKIVKTIRFSFTNLSNSFFTSFRSWLKIKLWWIFLFAYLLYCKSFLSLEVPKRISI